MRRAVAAALDCLIPFWVLVIGPLCLLLRDGLGPDAVESHNAHAVARFLMTFYWGPVLVGLVALRLLVRRGARTAVSGGATPDIPRAISDVRSFV